METECKGDKHVILKDGTCACESAWAKSPAGKAAVEAAEYVLVQDKGDSIGDAVDYFNRPVGARLADLAADLAEDSTEGQP